MFIYFPYPAFDRIKSRLAFIFGCVCSGISTNPLVPIPSGNSLVLSKSIKALCTASSVATVPTF